MLHPPFVETSMLKMVMAGSSCYTNLYSGDPKPLKEPPQIHLQNSSLAPLAQHAMILCSFFGKPEWYFSIQTGTLCWSSKPRAQTMVYGPNNGWFPVCRTRARPQKLWIRKGRIKQEAPGSFKARLQRTNPWFAGMCEPSHCMNGG